MDFRSRNQLGNDGADTCGPVIDIFNCKQRRMQAEFEPSRTDVKSQGVAPFIAYDDVTEAPAMRRMNGIRTPIQISTKAEPEGSFELQAIANTGLAWYLEL